MKIKFRWPLTVEREKVSTPEEKLCKRYNSLRENLYKRISELEVDARKYELLVRSATVMEKAIVEYTLKNPTINHVLSSEAEKDLKRIGGNIKRLERLVEEKLEIKLSTREGVLKQYVEILAGTGKSEKVDLQGNST